MLVNALTWLGLDLIKVFPKVIINVLDEHVNLFEDLHWCCTKAKKEPSVQEVSSKAKHYASCFNLEIFPLAIVAILLLNKGSRCGCENLFQALIELI